MIHDRRAANPLYLIHAPPDAALAEQISRDLAVRGTTVHGDYEDHLPDIDSEHQFRQSAVLIVLCTAAGMPSRLLQRRAAAALAYTHESTNAILIPLLLDDRADSTTMFGPFEWLAPTGSAPSVIAHDILETIYGRASPASPEQHVPLDCSPDESQHQALAVVRQSFARATFADRAMRTALVAILMLSAVVAVLGLGAHQTPNAILMMVVSPLLVFSGIVLGSHQGRGRPGKSR
jgi:hypothetical protein